MPTISVFYRQYYLWGRSSDLKRDGSTRRGNKTRDLDRFGPSGGGNTLRHVCGCVILVLGCCELLSTHMRLCGSLYWDVLMSKGVPLPSLYTRGAGLHGRVLVGLQGRSPSWLQLYLLYVRKAVLSLFG